MESKTCMNVACGARNSTDWKKGWKFESDEFVDLCFTCGSAFEKSAFCNTFHLEEDGWRPCRLCNKPLHCGCIASKSLLRLLDLGGVGCITCTENLGLHLIPSDKVVTELSPSTAESTQNQQPTPVANIADIDTVDKGNLMPLGNIMEGTMPPIRALLPQKDTIKREEFMNPPADLSKELQILTQPSLGPHKLSQPDNFFMPAMMSGLTAPSGASSFEQSIASSSFQQEQRPRPLFLKPLKLSPSSSPSPGPSPSTSHPEAAAKGVLTQMRVARPPAEGRGRSQLLPRYWPRVTDQELQQMSGDLNSNVVPLFEKVLSASDAGKIGRLVLPKACAEAYFPPITQSEGLPLVIQDMKGKEWTMQFRFWPNNNSRMYVLEGVTPCIQSMQLQAGDTVIFSRRELDGKLVMGFRKGTNTENIQDSQTASRLNSSPGDMFFPNGNENLPSVSGYSGIFQSVSGSKNSQLDPRPERLSIADGDIGWDNKQGDSSQQSKKKTRNIKIKRLHMHSEDVRELRLTWEEAQDLLRPPPCVKPSIVMIEDHEFEEYDVPPVFGKKTVFTAQPSGEQDQWAQCDSCSKWRRLPMAVLIPAKWTCADNGWDPRRCLCSVPEEMNFKDRESLFRGLKKRKVTGGHEQLRQECEPSGLDALASVAVLGENVVDPSVGATTKHPKHRPGCTCIVCIQPPSGKGKHKPTCTCNVCLMVKRRFQTLMMNKKKRQTDLEAEVAQRNTYVDSKEVLEMGHIKIDVAEPSKGGIDLNCHPNGEDGDGEESMMSLVEAASRPLEMYLKQNGFTSLACEPQPSLSQDHLLSGDDENKGDEDSFDPTID